MRTIEIAAYVAESEEPIVRRAADELARAVAAASDEPTDARCRSLKSADDVVTLGEREIVVASLLRDVDGEETWSTTAARLHATYARFADRDVPAFVCTVFRHVDRGDDGADDASRERIRRLDLLAMELSRVTGAYVIDLDRAFADVGAFALETDYRLGGRAAIERAAYVIASALAVDALDGIVSVDVQNDAAAILNAARETLGADDGRDVTLLPGAVAIGRGPGGPRIKPVLVTVQSSRVDNALRDVVRGSIGPREIGSRLLHTVRRRGLRTTTTLLAIGLAKRFRLRR